MEPSSTESRPTDRPATFLDFTLLLRAVPLALSPTRLAIALIGVVATVAWGSLLDAVWTEASSPAVARLADRWVSEPHLYADLGGRSGAQAAIEAALSDGEGIRSQGAFDALLLELRWIEDGFISGTLGARPTQLVDALGRVVTVAAWLISMHPFYAVLFGLGLVAIWGFIGVALSRSASMEMATDERLSAGAALSFARQRFMDGVGIFLAPLVILLTAAVGLWLFGLIGAIPYLGELVVGLGFPLVILGGLLMAGILILALVAMPMAPCGVAVNDSDALDSLMVSGSYVVQRPIKTLVFFITAVVISVIAFALLKWFIALALWCGAGAVGATMNLGSPVLTEGAADGAPDKLNAIWTAPAPSGAVPFYGAFDASRLGGTSWFASGLVRGWLMLVWGLLAAFAVNLVYASAVIAFLLLRRDVDRTDMTEVATEFADKGQGSVDAAS